MGRRVGEAKIIRSRRYTVENRKKQKIENLRKRMKRKAGNFPKIQTKMLLFSDLKIEDGMGTLMLNWMDIKSIHIVIFIYI